MKLPIQQPPVKRDRFYNQRWRERVAILPSQPYPNGTYPNCYSYEIACDNECIKAGKYYCKDGRPIAFGDPDAAQDPFHRDEFAFAIFTQQGPEQFRIFSTRLP
jgi:hypothetical protein